jgi:hypothetical protein
MRSIQTLKASIGIAPRLECVIQNQLVLFELLCDIREETNLMNSKLNIQRPPHKFSASEKDFPKEIKDVLSSKPITKQPEIDFKERQFKEHNESDYDGEGEDFFDEDEVL